MKKAILITLATGAILALSACSAAPAQKPVVDPGKTVVLADNQYIDQLTKVFDTVKKEIPGSNWTDGYDQREQECALTNGDPGVMYSVKSAYTETDLDMTASTKLVKKVLDKLGYESTIDDSGEDAVWTRVSHINTEPAEIPVITFTADNIGGGGVIGFTPCLVKE